MKRFFLITAFAFAALVFALCSGCPSAGTDAASSDAAADGYYPSLDGEYAGMIVLTEDTCNELSEMQWTVLDVRVRNEDETLADLVLPDYDFFARDVEVLPGGSYVYHAEEDVWLYLMVTDASGELDGETASLDLTRTFLRYDKYHMPQKDEYCHVRYAFFGERRYPSYTPAD